MSRFVHNRPFTIARHDSRGFRGPSLPEKAVLFVMRHYYVAILIQAGRDLSGHLLILCCGMLRRPHCSTFWRAKAFRTNITKLRTRLRSPVANRASSFDLWTILSDCEALIWRGLALTNSLIH